MLWMDLLPMRNLITSFSSHLENIGSPSNVDLPNFDTFHYKIFLLSIFIHITTKPKRKLTECWEAIKLMMIDINFPIS